jgi:hypothetical protein
MLKWMRIAVGIVVAAVAVVAWGFLGGLAGWPSMVTSLGSIVIVMGALSYFSSAT